MGKYKSIIEIQGSVGEFSFYDSKFGPIVRRKRGPSRAQIMNEPSFIRTQENTTEFGAASTAGRVLRHAVKSMSRDISDRREAYRLTQRFLAILKCDPQSDRGQRRPEIGLSSLEGKSLLKGFGFNATSLQNVLLKPMDIDTKQHTLLIEQLDPKCDLRALEAASHVRLQLGLAQLDFAKEKGSLLLSDSVVLDLKGDLIDLKLSIEDATTKAGSFAVYLLKVEFLQELNGTLYPLKDQCAGVLEVVEVG